MRGSLGRYAATATEKLIKAYSPILMLRSQENGICDEGEEQFQPMAVESCSATAGSS